MQTNIKYYIIKVCYCKPLEFDIVLCKSMYMYFTQVFQLFQYFETVVFIIACPPDKRIISVQ